MRDPLTFTVWPWIVPGLVIGAGVLKLAYWYMDQPHTEADLGYSATDIDLGRCEGREPTIVGADLDTSDYDEAIDEWCDELFESLTRYLALRDKETR